jgi:MFS family permease
MSRMLDTLRGERRARAFLLTYAQSALGNGMAIVALVVIAYDRKPSPWSLTLVLLAYDLPPGFLSPFLGALVDRLPRRWCVIAADIVRAGAFAGMAVVGSIEATVAFALLAGAATALYSPAALASLPSLVDEERLPAVTSLYGGITDAGKTIGPALAAIAFPLIGADGVMLVNAATFAISAIVLTLIPFGASMRVTLAGAPPSFLQEVREGLRETTRVPIARVVVITSTGVILFASILNVAELPLAHELGAGASGFAVLLTLQGLGVVGGSLSGARGGGLGRYKVRYAAGALAVTVSMAMMSAIPVFAAVLVAFAIFGLGNGLQVVHERLMFQLAIPGRLMGRAFALLDALGAWAFAIAYLAAGVLLSALGTRGAIGIAAGGALAITLYAVIALRDAPDPRPASAPNADPAPAGVAD